MGVLGGRGWGRVGWGGASSTDWMHSKAVVTKGEAYLTGSTSLGIRLHTH